MKKIFILLLLIMFLTLALPLFAFDGLSDYTTPPAPKFTDAERQAELSTRRTAVAAKMSDNSVMVLFSAEPKLYTNDVNYVFRQENNLYYLTALKQEGITLVIKKTGGQVTETVYLPKRDPQRETWNGKKYSNEDAKAISGIKNIVDASELDALLQSLKSGKEAGVASVYLLLPNGERDEDGMREFRVENGFATSVTGYKVINAQPIFAELRQIKSPYELKLLQHAIDITTEAQMRAMSMVGSAQMEYEVQAEVEYTFRRRNADYWGYPSIVGCGPNSTTLHYEESQGPVTKGSVLLMDVGAEYDHYSADVTRTFPVNGKFTKEQADIYQIVYDAQEAAAKAAKPGATMSQLSQAANTVIKDGLFRLGLITDKNSQQFRMWYMHGLGHWLGMNVHDVGSTGTLAPGMTYTNEPGIYIRADALDYLPNTPENQALLAKIRPAFEKYKNIGVRIEDDMLITPTGVEWMTKKLPRKMSDIEAFMAKTNIAASRTSNAATEETVKLQTPTGDLFGTLTIPQAKGTIPVALIIAGSGPTDRNGNSPLFGGPNNAYSMLAEALARHGIASLRYDKRGIGASAAALKKELDIKFDDAIQDAESWLRLLRKDKRFSTITVVGHSEGSMVGMVAARNGNAGKYISISGTGQPAGQILLEQIKPQVPPELYKRSEEIVAELNAGKFDEAVPPSLNSLFRRSVQPYLISWFKYDPAIEIAKLKIPVLIVQGTTDIQVSTRDAHLLAAGNPAAQLLLIDGMNHILKEVPDDKTRQAASYGDPSLPIDPKLVEDIVKFIEKIGS